MSPSQSLRQRVTDFRRVCRLVWRVHGVQAGAESSGLAAWQAGRTELLRLGVTITQLRDLEAPYV